MSVPPRVTITAIRLELGQLSHAYANSLSSLHAILATLIADEAAYVPDDVLTELETLEASLCKKFDVLVNISNSTTAFYHTLVQRHGDCEQSIKELTASSNSNIVTNSNQLLQNMKTQVEQTMLLMEEVQHGTWEITQDMQILCK